MWWLDNLRLIRTLFSLLRILLFSRVLPDDSLVVSSIANVDPNLSFSINNYKSLSVFYTNTDQFVNKRDLLLVQIADKNPDLILISELLPKFSKFYCSSSFVCTSRILISMQIVSCLI